MHLWSRTHPYQPISTDARQRRLLDRTFLSDKGARHPDGRRERLTRSPRPSVKEVEPEPVSAVPPRTISRLSSTLAVLDIALMLDDGTATRAHPDKPRAGRGELTEVTLAPEQKSLDQLLASVLIDG